jgi:hypothetical protein
MGNQDLTPASATYWLCYFEQFLNFSELCLLPMKNTNDHSTYLLA